MKRLDAIKEENLGDNRFRVLLPGSFAGVSLLLSALGIYGVMSYSVLQRRHEIGIHMAVGAEPRDILRLVLKRGLVLTCIGLAIGLAGAVALTQTMQSLLFGISASDPVSFAAATTLLMLVAMLACLLPARRAMHVDPTVALRDE